MPRVLAISRGAPNNASSSIGRPASTSCSIDVLNAPSRAVTAIRSSPLSLIGHPTSAPIAASSAMPSSIQARHSGSARMRSQLARVSADSGLIVALPHNLYQIARRTLPVRSGRSPAASKTPNRRATRSLVSPPAGSPMISLSA